MDFIMKIIAIAIITALDILRNRAVETARGRYLMSR